MPRGRKPAEWTWTTPIMVMPDGTERSFDTFTKEELREWWIRANIRCMRAAGYELVVKEPKDKTKELKNK